MSNRNGRDQTAQDPTPSGETHDKLSVRPVEHYITGFLGLFLTLLASTLVYSPVASMADSMSYLSSTMLVFTFAAIWIAVWLVLVLLWEWRAGRLFTA